uniref:C-type lectin domain-containing protein n=1 Tax=Lates calcarifer TaxID=8187 RepID=A0A4W6CCZ7_LATCA
MSSDKDQDGVFKWVDKTAVTFSNYGPGWPRNTANLWDCGQIFTGRITETVKNWQDAEAHCTREQGHLASFHSQEELSFLTGEASSKWIVDPGGSYSWSDGSPLSHTNWGHGEPNNHEGREECVEMVSSTNGTSSWWNDLNCDAHQDWICMIAKIKRKMSITGLAGIISCFVQPK